MLVQTENEYSTLINTPASIWYILACDYTGHSRWDVNNKDIILVNIGYNLLILHTDKASPVSAWARRYIVVINCMVDDYTFP